MSAREFLLAFYIGEGPTPTETASGAVRWARRTMDQTAAAQAVADTTRRLTHA